MSDLARPVFESIALPSTTTDGARAERSLMTVALVVVTSLRSLVFLRIERARIRTPQKMQIEPNKTAGTCVKGPRECEVFEGGDGTW